MISVKMPKSAKLEKKYPNVVKNLRKKINDGTLDGALPGVKQLAKEYDVNFMTVNKAVKVLEEEGLVYRIPRKGTYVKRMKNIAFCFDDNESEVRIHSVFAPMYVAAQRYFSAQNCPMFLESGMSIRNQSMAMLKNRIDGLIFSGKVETINAIGINEIPMVRVLGEIEDNVGYDHVTYDNKSIGKLAAEFILEQGHSNIAYVGDQLPERFVCRCETFTDIIQRNGGKVSISPYEASTWEPRSKNIRLQMTEVFGQADKPTAIFCPSDNEVGLIYDNLYKLNLRPMEDVLIVSCNNDNVMMGCCDPFPVSIDIRMEDIGVLASKRLLERIENPGLEPRQDVLKPKINIEDSQ